MIFTGYKKEYLDILRLAIPVVLSQAGQMTVQIADNIMVGHLGAVPLAAVSFAGALFFMVFVLGMGMTLGLTPLVGEMFAQGRIRRCGEYLQGAMLFYVLLGVILFFLAMALIPLMPSMIPDPRVVEIAIPYYRYLVWSLLPFMLFAVFKQFLEGVGNTKVAMTIIIISNALNIFLNWLLIYGNLGFPEMGVTGAGISTLVARMITPLLVIVYFLKHESLRRYLAFFDLRSFRGKYIRLLFVIGGPISLQIFMEGGAFAVTGIMMGWIGTVEMAANQIATVISNFAFMILLGISSSLTIFISHAYGRRDWNEIRRYASAGYRLGLMWNAATALLFLTLRHYIPFLFSSDAQVIDMASDFLLFVAIFQISDGLQVNSVGILRGIQDVNSIMFTAFVSYIVVSLPLAWFLSLRTPIGAPGVWISLIVSLALAAFLLNYRYRRRLAQHTLSESDTV